MKRNTAIAALCGLLAAAGAFSGRLMAQAPPGPLPTPPASRLPKPRPAKPKPPAIPPRTTLDGMWKLNRDESDDARTKIQDSRGRSPSSRGGGGGGYPGGYPGGGYPPGTWPGDPTGPDLGGRETETDEELEALIRPPSSLTFTIKSAETEMTDDRYRKLVFVTDGRKLQKSKDDSYQEVAAKWNEKQLVSDEKTPRGAKFSRTFELSFDGRQMTESVRVARGKSKGSLLIRYVFDVFSPAQPADHASDPDQPVLKRHADGASDAPNPPSSAPPSAPPDPDQPVLRRNDAGGAPTQ